MQTYSHPDVFFCPLYNRPGISDPLMALCGSDEEFVNHDLFWTLPDTDSDGSAPSSSSSPSSSRDNSVSPPASTPQMSEKERKLRKWKRMSAKAGKSLLDFAAEMESRRKAHEKRRQVNASQSSRTTPRRPQLEHDQ